MKIPKLSAPLTKAIRTSEGIAVWGLNIALGVASAIPATHLTVKEAGILATVTTGIHVASRTALKVTAVSKDLGLPSIPFTPPAEVEKAVTVVTAATPTVAADVEQDVSKPSVDKVEEQVAELVGDTTEFAAQPPPPPAVATEPTPPATPAAP